MAKDLAIVLCSGSINSAVACALANQKYRLLMLHAEPVESSGSRQRAAYDQLVEHFKPYREHSLPMPFLSIFNSGSIPAPVAGDPRMPTLHAQQMIELLPLVAVGVRFAVHFQAAAIYVGSRIGTAAGDALASMTEYTQIWNEMIQLPCGQPELELVAPLLELEPWQVVDVGFQTGAPFERTWSCLGEGTEPCWACRGCRNREAAFQQAGKADPLRSIRK